jgi:3-hydroxy-3-methylglutaryl CoA synthase
LVVLTDCPRCDVFDPLDYGLGAASIAFVISRGEGLAELEGFASSVGEYMGEMFRPFGHPYLQALGISAYEAKAVTDIVGRAIRDLLKKLDAHPQAYTYLTLPHIPGVQRVAVQIGFQTPQIELGAVVQRVGDTGLCTPWLALGAILDVAQDKDRVLVVSYGYGSACYTFSFHAGKRPETLPARVLPKLQEGSYIDYMSYVRLRKGIQ